MKAEPSCQVAVLGKVVLAMATGSPGAVSVLQEERDGHVRSELLSTPGLHVRSFPVALCYCRLFSLQVSLAASTGTQGQILQHGSPRLTLCSNVRVLATMSKEPESGQ